ncbi:glutamate racemase [Candidatus Erwinia haradaeae]|uniref:Glutamate racemase n=1 Tax=Candidatus Erwinia haradaeae TaxID=1922217 RepID=A0A451D3F9_9GAMM|nr:Glutamate racemase [Candidatus Erwinia haradaeae]
MVKNKHVSVFQSASRLSIPCSKILIFDSGVGGLSVYSELCKLLPKLNYLYVFDNVAFPYGEKSEEITTKRVVSIITAVIRLYSVSLVVIACNSASIVSLPELRSRFVCPIVGVVPAIKPAAQLTRNGVIGLLATRGTLQRSYTYNLIERFASTCNIVMLGSKELVEIVESKLRGHLVSIKAVRDILEPWLFMSIPPDTVVLGCTHFSLIRDELKEVLPLGTKLIDSSLAIAKRIVFLLENQLNAEISRTPNIALCLDLTPQARELIPTLQSYGFDMLKRLIV